MEWRYQGGQLREPHLGLHTLSLEVVGTSPLGAGQERDECRPKGYPWEDWMLVSQKGVALVLCGSCTPDWRGWLLLSPE